MKKSLKILSVLAALPLFCINSSAQDVVSLNPISHFGYGYNIVKTSDFHPSASDEFFVNILTLKLRPVDYLGLDIGVDYKTVDFRSRDEAFYLDANKVIHAMPYKEKYKENYTRNFSRFRTNTFSTPVTFNFYAGDFAVRLGAEANFNLTGRVKDKFFVDGKKHKYIEKGARFNKFNYNFLASISYANTGIYFRYYPKNSRLMPEGGVDVSYMTVGVVFGM